MKNKNDKTEELNELLSKFYKETEKDEFLGNLGFAEGTFASSPVEITDFDATGNIKLRIAHHNRIICRWQYTAVSIAACLTIVVSFAFYANITGQGIGSAYQPLLAWEDDSSDLASISQGVEEITAQINTNIIDSSSEYLTDSLIDIASEIESLGDFWI